jgi:hypothetical protein
MTMQNLSVHFKYNTGKNFYCYLEDGIQYQMDFKSLIQLKEFLKKHYNMIQQCPINYWYKQLQREDKKEVIISINKSYCLK